MTGLKSGEALLSIGSNMGDKKENIEQAIRLLSSNQEIEVLKVAGLYETEPVGYEDQDYFYNTCVLIKTTLEPEELLDAAITEMYYERVVAKWDTANDNLQMSML